jgi:predicted heme/steroid binding protein
MKIFTPAELNNYNGKDGKKCYIANNGLVYDVTGSFHWKNGEHWVVHKAGQDLSSEMLDAPHFDDLLEKFEVVGKLEPQINPD